MRWPLVNPKLSGVATTREDRVLGLALLMLTELVATLEKFNQALSQSTVAALEAVKNAIDVQLANAEKA